MNRPRPLQPPAPAETEEPTPVPRFTEADVLGSDLPTHGRCPEGQKLSLMSDGTSRLVPFTCGSPGHCDLHSPEVLAARLTYWTSRFRAAGSVYLASVPLVTTSWEERWSERFAWWFPTDAYAEGYRAHHADLPREPEELASPVWGAYAAIRERVQERRKRLDQDSGLLSVLAYHPRQGQVFGYWFCTHDLTASSHNAKPPRAFAPLGPQCAADLLRRNVLRLGLPLTSSGSGTWGGTQPTVKTIHGADAQGHPAARELASVTLPETSGEDVRYLLWDAYREEGLVPGRDYWPARKVDSVHPYLKHPDDPEAVERAGRAYVKVRRWLNGSTAPRIRPSKGE